MNPVALLFAENSICRQPRQVEQRLAFCISVQNLGYRKSVEILWAGEDNCWQTLAAIYQCSSEDAERWQALTTHQLNSEIPLPGNIRFCIRLRVDDAEYWDNNNGRDYHCEADSGVLLGQGSVQQIDFQPWLPRYTEELALRFALPRSLNADLLLLQWTTSDWTDHTSVECAPRVDEWNRFCHSNARNPNQYGVRVFSVNLKCGDAFRIRYRVGYQSGGTAHWLDPQEEYVVERAPLRVMILNLHCYQEENQQEKLRQIARAMEEQDVDIACFQEVAENWNHGHGDWESNSARIINSHLPKEFFIHTDWSHLGFERYREGIGILSRFPLLQQEARYVSGSHDIHSIHSRKVVMAAIDVPHIGICKVFSVHLSWMEDGFTSQFENLHQWAQEMHSADDCATLLCGDFNVTCQSEGYERVIREYRDAYATVGSGDENNKIFRTEDGYWRDLSEDQQRIDYVFVKGKLEALGARVLFTEHDYGRVSDHCGYLITFIPGP